jgi:hypothetical protein
MYTYNKKDVMDLLNCIDINGDELDHDWGCRAGDIHSNDIYKFIDDDKFGIELEIKVIIEYDWTDDYKLYQYEILKFEVYDNDGEQIENHGLTDEEIGNSININF